MKTGGKSGDYRRSESEDLKLNELTLIDRGIDLSRDL